MGKRKTISLKSFLGLMAIEMLVLAYWYFNSELYRELQELYSEINQQDLAIKNTQKQIEILKGEIDDWQKYPYYREKIVRENLQLAHPSEELYRNS
ncbi:MAG TPA: septum formation initiator family protein [Candidatus Babeliaceae bacterium]|nr:septum formation initiator family protein [Candidatus Babeliaceae bacterium]